MTALVWAIGGGALGTAIAVIWALIEKNGRIGAEKDLLLMTAQANDAKRQFNEEQVARADERGRLEFVAIQLKREAALAREEFRACVDAGGAPPGSIADALERMLATPISGIGPTASATVPDGPATTAKGNPLVSG